VREVTKPWREQAKAKKQKQVLSLVKEGLSVTEIGKKTKLPKQTVHNIKAAKSTNITKVLSQKGSTAVLGQNSNQSHNSPTIPCKVSEKPEALAGKSLIETCTNCGKEYDVFRPGESYSCPYCIDPNNTNAAFEMRLTGASTPKEAKAQILAGFQIMSWLEGVDALKIHKKSLSNIPPVYREKLPELITKAKAFIQLIEEKM